MLSTHSGLPEVLAGSQIGFVTAVNSDGQPQTSPVWFIRDGEDLVVYNQPVAPRLQSIVSNPRVAFSLRADPKAHALVSMEGTAAVDPGLPPAHAFPGYLDKYLGEIEALGWTPQSFSDDYSVGIRITVSRVRVSGMEHLLHDKAD